MLNKTSFLQSDTPQSNSGGGRQINKENKCRNKKFLGCNRRGEEVCFVGERWRLERLSENEMQGLKGMDEKVAAMYG